MKHRTSTEQHHGKKPRVPAAAASTSVLRAMEDETPPNPRELTQNPLKKIWMPCKNGLPEAHISQRKGAYVWRRVFSCPPPPRGLPIVNKYLSFLSWEVGFKEHAASAPVGTDRFAHAASQEPSSARRLLAPHRKK